MSGTEYLRSSVTEELCLMQDYSGPSTPEHPIMLVQQHAPGPFTVKLDLHSGGFVHVLPQPVQVSCMISCFFVLTTSGGVDIARKDQ